MPYNILVVDDEKDVEELIKQGFKKEIRNNEWMLFFAHNGTEALNIIENHPDIVVILLDVNMPNMDGFSFLEELNKRNNPCIKTIFITAYDDMKNIRKAMNLGAFDFLVKPLPLNDLSATIKKTITQIDTIKKSTEEHDELVALKSELKIASQIQKSLVSTAFPNHEKFEIYAEMIQAKQVGGDLYDFFFIDDDRVGFVIGDVTGKGIPAAIFMARCCSLIKTTAIKVGNPGESLVRINNQIMLEKKDDPNRSLTLFYSLLNLKTGVMEYSSAGHLPPYLITTNCEVKKISHEKNFPIGYFEKVIYETKKITLKPNAMILLYTDGLIDAENPNGKKYGGDEKKIKSILKSISDPTPEKTINGLLTSLKNFVFNHKQVDDITLLAFRYKY